MKIAIIGAGGMRTPLLLNGILQSDLPVHQVDLYDPDEARLGGLYPVMEAVARIAPRAPELRRRSDSRAAIQGADFVLTSIRVGGMARRAADEAVALSHGLLGQETVGPAGFAMAMRTIGPMLEYASQVESLAPDAFLINFSNPVGMVTQAVASQTAARIIGICDTPTELFEDAAAALGVPSQECFFDFVGLNHLGWLREVYHQARPRMGELLAHSRRLYRAPFFEEERLLELGMLPTEYVYFYEHPDRAVAGILKAGRSRGAQLEELNQDLFERIGRGGEPLQVYGRYLSTRNHSYMQSETGKSADARGDNPVVGSPLKGEPHCGCQSKVLGAELTGYDKIALSVLRAIHFNLRTLLPLNVANRGNLTPPPAAPLEGGASSPRRERAPSSSRPTTLSR